MTTNQDLCERLRKAAEYQRGLWSKSRFVEVAGKIEDEAAALIEAQAKQIADSERHRNDLADKIVSQHTEIGALKSRIDEMERAILHEVVVYEGTQACIAELEAKVASAEKATRFAGLVLAEHRNDGYPDDVDGDDLQRFALESGMIEERTVAGPCGERCSCAETISESEFPTTCYFNTEAGKAAISTSEAKP